MNSRASGCTTTRRRTATRTAVNGSSISPICPSNRASARPPCRTAGSVSNGKARARASGSTCPGSPRSVTGALTVRSSTRGAGSTALSGEAGRDFARASLERLQSDRQLRSVWLTRLLQDGMAFLSGVPAAEDALLASMRLVGQVAETNYGLVFDVRSVPQPENLAYSDLGLGLHTDNPVPRPRPGFSGAARAHRIARRRRELVCRRLRAGRALARPRSRRPSRCSRGRPCRFTTARKTPSSSRSGR